MLILRVLLTADHTIQKTLQERNRVEEGEQKNCSLIIHGELALKTQNFFDDLKAANGRVRILERKIGRLHVFSFFLPYSRSYRLLLLANVCQKEK